MTYVAIRRAWGPFKAGWYRSTDGRFDIFAVGWDATPAARVHRCDGRAYGYDLYEGDVKRGRFTYVDLAMAAAKALKTGLGDCAWCGGEIFEAFPNRRGECFCSKTHRDASGRALRGFLRAEDDLTTEKAKVPGRIADR